MTVRVAHRPSRHPYVDQLADGGVTTIDVPDVFDVGAVRSEADVVHLHFGFEHVDDRRLSRWAEDLRRSGIGLVFTAHDLDNPHVVDQRPHHRAVRALAGAADAVVSLTPWAAAELRRRTGIDSTVIAHPPVVRATELQAARSPERRGVYVHAATLRPNLDLDLLEGVAGAELSVHVREGHLADAPADVRRRIERLASVRGVRLDVGPRLTDGELWARVAEARAVLLPYRWGTHSGLLEAARDLGTPCVAPAHGGYGDQGAATFTDAASCAPLLADPPAMGPRPTSAEQVAAAHRQLYQRVLEGRAA